MQIIDSHCHLDRLKLDKLASGSLDEVIQDAKDNHVEFMLCVGIDKANAGAVKAIADEHDNVCASVGVHPCDVADDVISTEELAKLADHDKVVAIGETGLDYHYTAESKTIQQESFALHLDVAKQLALPTIVHTREAKRDTLDLIAGHACRESAGVLHCFTEDIDMARAALDLGFYISFSGIVTFKNALELKDVAKYVPEDRLLVETDAPYLTPMPYRGKPNFPKYTYHVVEHIAQLRQVPMEQIASATSDNFFRLFSKAQQCLKTA